MTEPSLGDMFNLKRTAAPLPPTSPARAPAARPAEASTSTTSQDDPTAPDEPVGARTPRTRTRRPDTAKTTARPAQVHAGTRHRQTADIGAVRRGSRRRLDTGTSGAGAGGGRGAS